MLSKGTRFRGRRARVEHVFPEEAGEPRWCHTLCSPRRQRRDPPPSYSHLHDTPLSSCSAKMRGIHSLQQAQMWQVRGIRKKKKEREGEESAWGGQRETEWRCLEAARTGEVQLKKGSH